MFSQLEPEDASLSSERPVTSSDYSPATRPSRDAGDRAALVFSRSRSRSRGQSSRAHCVSGRVIDVGEIGHAAIEAASLRLELAGVSVRQLRAVAADIAAAMEARSERALPKAASSAVFSGPIDVPNPWILVTASQTEQPIGTSVGYGTSGTPASKVPDLFCHSCGVRVASGSPCGAECVM